MDAEWKLTVCGLLEIHVRVAEGSARYQVATDANREDWPRGGEFLEEHGLRDVGMQVPNVQRRHGVVWGARIHRFFFCIS